MGKKSRKPKSSQGGEDIRPGNLMRDAQRYQASRAEASKRIDKISCLPFSRKKSAIEELLIEIGTDVELNRKDPTGDGDQTPIAQIHQRDIARHLFSSGGAGEMEGSVANHALSPFAMTCAVGALKAVSQAVEDLAKSESKPYSKNDKMRSLLDGRETSMRLSPLLLIVSLGKGITGGNQDFQGVAKLLLNYGASPVAKDVVGKTVCHYGAGTMATKMTLDVVDMCIYAAKSHHMYDNEVELYGLNTQEMNGKVGIAGGFDVDAGRRSVYLQDGNREVWIKPEKMKLVKPSDAQSYPMLTDIQDRMGSVSLHELCLPQYVSGHAERSDVAQFLLAKHRTCIHTKETDGISPFQMVAGAGQTIGATEVAKLIMEAATRDARETTKAKRQDNRCCANCEAYLGKDALSCSGCKVTLYCNRECQIAHWAEHKKDCKDLAAISLGVKLEPPNIMRLNLPELPPGTSYTSSNFKTGKVSTGINYAKPSMVEYDKKFVVKVQASRDDNNARPSIYVYDQSRTCKFQLLSGQAGFQQVLTEVRKEPAWGGQKTFMKASFDRTGTCTMYPETAGVKAHYTF